MIEPKRMTDQNARVELRRLDARYAKSLRQGAACLRNRDAARSRDHASSAASSSA
jgi:hypothetical protein